MKRTEISGRYYMILLRIMRPVCGCGLCDVPSTWDPSFGDFHYWQCKQRQQIPTERWQFWEPTNSSSPSVYDSPGAVRRSLPHALGKRPRDGSVHRVVFFEAEDLRDVTEDADVVYQQAENQVVRAATTADGARAGANPVAEDAAYLANNVRRKRTRKVAP